MKSLVVAGVALSLAACHKQPGSTSSALPGAPASTADVDALWALAPDGATAGVVVSPRALTMTEHAWQDILSFASQVPELAPAVPRLQAELQKELGTPTLSLAAAGLVPGKGLAVFYISKDSGVFILPVGDRDRFLAITHGVKGADFDTLAKMKCKTVRGLYACASDQTRLDTLGKGNLRAQLADAGARGDVEVAGTIDRTRFAVVLQLARGAFVLRGMVDGLPDEMKGTFGLAKTAAPADAAGFGLVAFQPLLAKLSTSIPAAPIAPGITVRDVFASIDGVVTFTAPGGKNVIDARIGLRDPAPMTALLKHCEDLPIGAKLVAGKCHVSNPKLKGLTPDLWVEGNALRARVEMPVSGGGTAPMSSIGAELASAQWSMAFWGRGTALTSSYDASGEVDPSKLDNMELKIGVGVALRAFALLNEVGGGFAVDGDHVRFMFGVRTAWANPDDVVAKIIAVDPQDILHGRAVATARAIAAAAPSSPFAEDVRASTVGMVVVAAPIGALVAIAVPAFLDYMKKSKVSEAAVELNALGKHAKVIYGDTGAFAKGKAALLPANPDQKFGNNCCGGHGGTRTTPGAEVNNKCSADPAAFAKDPVWQALGFSVAEQSSYQYDYQSDGKTFTARAIGDADCDGNSATFELHGSIDAAGNPTVELVKPPPGVY